MPHRPDRRIFALSVPTLVFGVAIFGVAALAAASDIHPMLRSHLERASRGEPTLSILRPAGEAAVPATREPIGVWVRTRDGGATLEAVGLLPAGPRALLRHARWTPEQIRAAAAEASVVALSPAVRCRSFLDSSLVECGVEAVHEGAGVPPVYVGLTGEGVLVGIVDSGIDHAHGDFENDLGDTRIVSIWDQTVASSDPPAGFAYGKEWMAAQIDAGIATETDPEGHGTHVAGTAAGDGSATGNGEPAYTYVGVAPESPIVVVKTDFLTTSIVDAVLYIFQKADSIGVPAVVNLSLGTHYGAHDGTDEMASGLSLLAGPGRITVAAAGNEAGDGIHAEAVVNAPNSVDLTFEVADYPANPGSQNDEIYFDGWYTGGTNLSVTFVTPGSTVVGPVVKGGFLNQSTADGRIEIQNATFPSPNGDHEVYVRIYDESAASPPTPGTWTLRLDGIATTPEAVSSEFDVWNFYSSMPAPFVQGLEEAEIVASPAAGDSVIAVAAYVTKTRWDSIDGHTYGYTQPPPVRGIAPFSSIGPRRDGVLKPDVAAPGMGIAAALSGDASFPVQIVMPDGAHVLQQGTSMASPHVAGLVALMLQNLGTMSVAGLRDRLAGTARSDAFTGAVPNTTWGAGKIEALGATGYVVPVTMLEASAVQERNRVLVRFLLSEDAGTNPFPIWREDPWQAGRMPLGLTTSGRERLFVDSTLTAAGRYLYWLQADDAGREIWIGPAVVQFEPRVRSGLWASPNPFVGTIQIGWNVPGAARSLSIHDLAGRRIRRIEDAAVLRAGQFAWDGKDGRGERMPAGLYWARLETSDGARVSMKLLRLQ